MDIKNIINKLTFGKFFKQGPKETLETKKSEAIEPIGLPPIQHPVHVEIPDTEKPALPFLEEDLSQGPQFLNPDGTITERYFDHFVRYFSSFGKYSERLSDLMENKMTDDKDKNYKLIDNFLLEMYIEILSQMREKLPKIKIEEIFRLLKKVKTKPNIIATKPINSPEDIKEIIENKDYIKTLSVDELINMYSINGYITPTQVKLLTESPDI